jgi:hypothetical protein
MVQNDPFNAIDLSYNISSSQTLFGNSFKDAEKTATRSVKEVIPKWNLGTSRIKDCLHKMDFFNHQPVRIILFETFY